jgi:hypothetical protein
VSTGDVHYLSRRFQNLSTHFGDFLWTWAESNRRPMNLAALST